jgi:ADP-heptose:LPS heptosyltransferase
LRSSISAPKLDNVGGAFLDTAAVMKNLDLVVTCDTSIAHLAGALGVPVWVALRQAGEWRWLIDRADSPWYPSMRLFHQTHAGDWQGVFTQMAAELERLVSTTSTQRP